MKFLFDQNISHRILKLLPEKFKDSSSIKKEGLINAHDKVIWDFAKENDFIIVTQDSDFNDLNLLYGFPPKVVWIRTGNLKTQEIVDVLLNHFEEVEDFIKNENYGCFEIVSIK